MALKVIDGAGSPQNLSTTFDASGNLVGATSVTDPVSGLKLTVNPSGAGGAALVSSDGAKPTYRYAILGATIVTVVGDVVTITGSATKTVRVKRIALGGVSTTASVTPLQLIKRSTADTGGTFNALTAAKHDDFNDPTATAVVGYYSGGGAPTPGTQAGGAFGVGRLNSMAAAGAQALPGLVWEFATRQDKAIVLRGAANVLAINAPIGIPTGSAWDIEIETEEDNS